jgi:hypothetical protein
MERSSSFCSHDLRTISPVWDDDFLFFFVLKLLRNEFEAGINVLMTIVPAIKVNTG